MCDHESIRRPVVQGCHAPSCPEAILGGRWGGSAACVLAGSLLLAAVSPVSGRDPEPGKTFQDRTYTRTLGVAFSPDGKLLAVGAGTRTNARGVTLVWEVKTGKLRHTLRIDRGESFDVSHNWVGFDPKGKTLASLGTGVFFLWDPETGKHLRTFVGKGMDVRPAWSPDGKFIAAGSGFPEKSPLALWGADADKEPEVLRPHPTGPVLCVAFHPDGKRIISGGSDRTIRVTRLGSKKSLATLGKHEGVVSRLALSPDGKVLASAADDGRIKLWDLGKGEEIASSRERVRDVTGLAISPDGKLVATTSMDGRAHLWDARTGKPRGEWTAHPFRAFGVAFSPDGKALATCSENNGVKLWSLKDVLTSKD